MASGESFSQESVLSKWLAIELGRINDGVVADRRRLTDLLATKNPVAVTRGKKEYVLDRTTLSLLNKNLPPELRTRLRLPIIFFFDSTISDSCLLNDEAALEALKSLGELSSQRTMTGGKTWVGRAIVYAIMRKYPSLIQIMMY